MTAFRKKVKIVFKLFHQLGVTVELAKSPFQITDETLVEIRKKKETILSLSLFFSLEYFNCVKTQ